MTERLTIELEDGALLASIDRAIAALQSPGDLMEDIGAKLEQNAELRFDTKTDPNGEPWAALRPATLDIYKSDWFIKHNPAFKGGIPGTLLERTRALRQSLAHNAGTDYVDIGTNRATTGGRWQVGMLMETGTVKMKRRGILTADPLTGRLGAGDEADVLDIVGQYLDGLFA